MLRTRATRWFCAERTKHLVLIVDNAVVEDLQEVEVDYQSVGDDHQTPGG